MKFLKTVSLTETMRLQLLFLSILRGKTLKEHEKTDSFAAIIFIKDVSQNLLIYKIVVWFTRFFRKMYGILKSGYHFTVLNCTFRQNFQFEIDRIISQSIRYIFTVHILEWFINYDTFHSKSFYYEFINWQNFFNHP